MCLTCYIFVTPMIMFTHLKLKTRLSYEVVTAFTKLAQKQIGALCLYTTSNKPLHELRAAPPPTNICIGREHHNHMQLFAESLKPIRCSHEQCRSLELNYKKGTHEHNICRTLFAHRGESLHTGIRQNTQHRKPTHESG